MLRKHVKCCRLAKFMGVGLYTGPSPRGGARAQRPPLVRNKMKVFWKNKKKRPNDQAEEQTNNRKCEKRYFKIFSPAAPIGTAGDGYYKVKRDQNFYFLSANVWKALKTCVNIQQFFTEISSWTPEVAPSLEKNFVHNFCMCAPHWQNPGDGPVLIWILIWKI